MDSLLRVQWTKNIEILVKYQVSTLNVSTSNPAPQFYLCVPPSGPTQKKQSRAQKVLLVYAGSPRPSGQASSWQSGSQPSTSRGELLRPERVIYCCDATGEGDVVIAHWFWSPTFVIHLLVRPGYSHNFIEGHLLIASKLFVQERGPPQQRAA